MTRKLFRDAALRYKSDETSVLGLVCGMGALRYEELAVREEKRVPEGNGRVPALAILVQVEEDLAVAQERRQRRVIPHVVDLRVNGYIRYVRR